MVEHVNIPDSELHEPKGAATAAVNTTYVSDGASSGTWTEPEPKGVRGETANKVYVTNGANSGTMTSTEEIVRMGVWDYNDAATSTTPISLTPTGTDVDLTNDELGANTNKTYKLSDVTDVWDASTNRFDFSELSLGDVVDLRIDVTVTTTSSNTDTVLKINLGIGGTVYSLKIDRSSFKTAGTYQIVKMFSVYMGDTNTLNNPASLTLSSDSGSATCVVNGWYAKVLKKGLS